MFMHQYKLRKKLEEFQPDKYFTCEICTERKPSNEIFDNHRACVHPFCQDCIVHYINVEVENNISDVKCPDLICNNLLDPLNCQTMIPATVFVKWSDNLCNKAVLKFDKCYCPKRKCSVLVVNECMDTNVTKVKCPICKTFFCFKCKCAWHAGYWCGEGTKLKDKNDREIGKLIEKKKWTRCPGCGQSAELISGCPRVKCRCGQIFCYNCGRNKLSGDVTTLAACSCGVLIVHNICCYVVPFFVLLILVGLVLTIFLRRSSS